MIEILAFDMNWSVSKTAPLCDFIEDIWINVPQHKNPGGFVNFKFLNRRDYLS